MSLEALLGGSMRDMSYQVPCPPLGSVIGADELAAVARLGTMKQRKSAPGFPRAWSTATTSTTS